MPCTLLGQLCFDEASLRVSIRTRLSKCRNSLAGSGSLILCSYEAVAEVLTSCLLILPYITSNLCQDTHNPHVRPAPSQLLSWSTVYAPFLQVSRTKASILRTGSRMRQVTDLTLTSRLKFEVAYKRALIGIRCGHNAKDETLRLPDGGAEFPSAVRWNFDCLAIDARGRDNGNDGGGDDG